MHNQKLAEIFDHIADILELKGESSDKFRILSYRKAALIIRELPNDLAEIKERGKLTEIPGVGESLAKKIEDYLKTGHVPLYEKLKKEYPPSLFELLSVPHLGPKKVKVLFEELGVTSIESLEEVIAKGVVATLPNFGEKTVENILEGIRIRKSVGSRRMLGQVYIMVEQLMDYLKKCPGIIQLAPAGSFRRKKETIGDIDLLATGKDPKKIVDYFLKHPDVSHVLAHGDTKGSVILSDAQQVDLRVLHEDEWGAALQYFTGSKEHNVQLRTMFKEQGYKMNEYGLFKDEKKIAGKTEEGFYEALGMQWVPPEMRENRGEIEAALKKELPVLIELADIKGDLHLHTSYSDGSNSILEMARAAQARGYEYLALTDHSPSLTVANGLSPERLKAKQKEIDEVQKKVDIHIFSGSEVDILKDGSLDYPDAILKELDFVVASVHSHFNQDNTERIMKAMENPHVHAIGHLSGRMIGVRDGYALDYSKIFKKAVETNTLIEINSQYMRLDLQEKYIHEAQKYGVKFIINTDSHQADSLWLMTLGVSMARRGWLRAKDVVNTYSLQDFKRFIGGKF